jgi:hypothetical protein
MEYLLLNGRRLRNFLPTIIEPEKLYDGVLFLLIVPTFVELDWTAQSFTLEESRRYIQCHSLRECGLGMAGALG